MNKKLQFSWGHIIAFIALIATCYFSFVGFTYLTDGNFIYAAVGTLVTVVLYVFFFIAPQQLKAAGVNMKKKIVWERILLFASPLVFVAGMVSMSHFWTVRSQNDSIVETFRNSINSSRQLFSDYEAYSQDRIDTYEENLDKIVIGKDKDPRTFADAGFESSKADVQKENMVDLLRLQLMSQNYESLKSDATAWIDKASEGANTWNVFLLGNTREIKDALGNWESMLQDFSSKELSNEAMMGEVPHFESDGVRNAVEGIDSLTSSFTTQRAPTAAAIVFGIVLYLMLLFPYIIQERHSKSSYTNLVSKKKRFKTVELDKDSKSTASSNSGTFRLN